MRFCWRYLRRISFIGNSSRSAGCSHEEKISISSASKLEELIEKGMAFAIANDHANALLQFERAIEVCPDSSIVYCHAGIAAFEIGVLDTAQDYFVLALHYDAKNEDAILGLARVSRATGRKDRAIALLHGLTAASPERGDAWHELACCQHADADFEGAVKSLEQDLRSRPNWAPSLNFLGLIVAREFGQLKQGEEIVRRALQFCPDFSAALSNLGWILAEQGRLAEALSCFDQVLGSLPNDEETRLMRAYTLLKNGKFEAGWRDFSARHASPLSVGTGFMLPELPLQTDLDGMRVLVYSEQGLGDQIMFASCLPDFLELGAQCALECDDRLVSLFQRSFPGCRVFSRSSSGLPAKLPIDLGEFDGQLAIGNLPAIFRKEPQSFPSHKGYLRPDPEKVSLWRKRLADAGSGPYIGISWRGGTQLTRRQLRSIPLQQWKPILTHPGKFISLQYGECKADLALAEEAGFRIQHWPHAIEDYDETAALVAALDLVISVCTAVVHLGGAIGKPVWVLTPAVAEWRYLSQGERLPWYPSVRLFRQRPDADWSEVMTRVARSLESGSMD